MNSTSELRPVVEDAAAREGIFCTGACSLAGLSRKLAHRTGNRVEAIAAEGGSAIVLLLPYYAGEFPERNLSRYAIGADYHRVAGAILSCIVAALEAAAPEGIFLPFVDSSPLPEVELAVKAGLGIRGKNGQLITADYGSMVFICEIVTNLAISWYPAAPPPQSCGECTRCLKACPTGALTGSGLDLGRCRSHITQKKGEITPWEAQQILLGGFVWGCDICTDICPRNRGVDITPVAAMRENLTPVLTAENLDSVRPDKSYNWRGRGPLIRNLEIISGKER